MSGLSLRQVVLPAVLSAAVGFAGCAHRYARNVQTPTGPIVPAPSGPAAPTAAPLAEPDVREASLRIMAEVKAVHFNYDSAFVGPEARAVLVQNAGWLKAHPETRAQAAGHCDERGTVEYNLALGQRRAQAVKEYYRNLGIGEERIATISYGEENPLCRESNEKCWQANRRVETLVAFPEAAGTVDQRRQ